MTSTWTIRGLLAAAARHVDSVIIGRGRSLAVEVGQLGDAGWANDTEFASAAGGLPVMSRAEGDQDALACSVASLLVNAGSLRSAPRATVSRAVAEITVAGKPIVFDAVGMRSTQAGTDVGAEVHTSSSLAVIVGTAVEMAFHAGMGGEGHRDTVAAALVRAVARKYNAVAILYDAIVYISDGDTAVAVPTWHWRLDDMIGTGGAIGAVVNVYVGAGGGDPFVASVAAVLALSVAGENAAVRGVQRGNYRTAVLDQLKCVDGHAVRSRARVELLEESR